MIIPMVKGDERRNMLDKDILEMFADWENHYFLIQKRIR